MAEAWNHRGAVGQLFCPPTGRPRDRISDAQAKMPVHYAGSRYALSRFCKHYAYFVAAHVRDYTTWEVIPPPAVDEACRLAKDEAALAVEQDTARSSLEPPRLKLTAVARERLRKRSKTMAYRATNARGQSCVMELCYARSGTRACASMAILARLHIVVLRSTDQAVFAAGITLLWSAGAQRCSGWMCIPRLLRSPLPGKAVVPQRE